MRKGLRWFALAALLGLPLRAVWAGEADEEASEDSSEESSEEAPATNALAIGFKGYWDAEANSRSFDWGPTVNLDLFSSPKWAENRFKYGFELSYDDAFYRLASDGSNDQSRVRTYEIKYAKLSLLRALGFDIRTRLGVVPYVTGGIQYVDSREDSGGERTNRFFWAPTWGFGFEFDVTKRLTLGFDFNRNTEGGDRRVSRMSIEAKLYVFGEADE